MASRSGRWSWACAFTAGIGRGPWRQAWLLMAGGLLLHVLSSLVAAVSPGGAASFPTAAEPLALLGQSLTVAAVFVLLRHRSPGQALDILFEAVTVATALGFVIWALGIEPVAAAAPGSPTARMSRPCSSLILRAPDGGGDGAEPVAVGEVALARRRRSTLRSACGTRRRRSWHRRSMIRAAR